MSAVDVLLALVKPLAEPAAEALVDLIKGALEGDSAAVSRAKGERAATLIAFKGAIGAAADAKRAELLKGSKI